MTKRFSEKIFFILIAIVYIIFFLVTNYLYVGTTSYEIKGTLLFISSAIFTLCVLGYTHFTNLFNNENFKEYPSSGVKLCKGGPYMWQGNSDRAKFCRDLYSTPQGKYEIDTIGHGVDFEFTPVYDQYWCNRKCDKDIKYEN